MLQRHFNFYRYRQYEGNYKESYTNSKNWFPLYVNENGVKPSCSEIVNEFKLNQEKKISN